MDLSTVLTSQVAVADWLESLTAEQEIYSSNPYRASA